MFKAILFDLDNTLINFLEFKIETAKAAAKAMVANGLPATEVEAYGKIFTVYDEKGIEYQKTFSDVVKQYGLEINLAERVQQAAILAYLQKKFEVLRTYPIVKPTLATLREDYKLGVVTDAPRNKAWQRLIITGLCDYFEVVITLDDTLAFKPSPGGFNLALKKLNLAAPECLFVGDNPERDIKGAQELGMKTVLAKYGWNKRKTDIKADYEISRFEDLFKVL